MSSSGDGGGGGLHGHAQQVLDLDSLLGDLERTIERRSSQPNTSVVNNNQEYTSEVVTTSKEIISDNQIIKEFNSRKSYKSVSSPVPPPVVDHNDAIMAAATVSPNPAINQNINELDTLLNDLSNAR